MNYTELPSFWSNNKKGMSYTRLSTLLECPLRHYFQYVLGMRVDKDIPAINMGVGIHKVLEGFHSHEPFDTKDNAVTYVLSEWKRIWKESKETGLAVGDKKTSYNANLELGELLLSEYMNNLYSKNKNKSISVMQYKYPTMLNPMPATELPFKIPMIDLLTGKSLVNGYNLTGIIDLLLNVNEAYYVLDHKVLSIKPKQFLIDNDIQLVIYAYVLLFLALKDIIIPNPIDPNTLSESTTIDVGFNYMLKPYSSPDWSNRRKEPEFQRVTRKISVKEINGVLRIIANAINGFELSSNRPTPSYGDHCSWKCDLTGPCAAFRIMEDPIKAFEKQYGPIAEKKNIEGSLTKEELF